MSEDVESEPRTHTVRLELVDRPGELLSALEPIAEHGGNLLSIFHERGNITPRGRIPVEVDFECPPDRFEVIVESLRSEGINVMQAGEERYSEDLVLVLVGHLIDTDLSDTLNRIEECSSATVVDFSLVAPEGRSEERPSSARVRLAARSGDVADVIAEIRAVTGDKDLSVIPPVEAEVEG